MAHLTLDQANHLCRALVPIGGLVPTLIEQLQTAGFAAFLPRKEFIESFAESEEELAVHHRFAVEEAKSNWGVPWPWGFVMQRSEIYQSPFIQEMAAARDRENGVPVQELQTRYPEGGRRWRYEADPCLRHRYRWEIEHKEDFKRRWEKMLRAQQRRIDVEVARHATALSSGHSMDAEDRYSVFRLATELHWGRSGFAFDKKKSRKRHPAFSKPIVDGWDISLVIEEANMFLLGPRKGDCYPHLELRRTDFRRGLNEAKPVELLHFRFQSTVPGFFNAYWEFGDLDELELYVKAQATLYALIAPIFEDAIRRNLPSG